MCSLFSLNFISGIFVGGLWKPFHDNGLCVRVSSPSSGVVLQPPLPAYYGDGDQDHGHKQSTQSYHDIESNWAHNSRAICMEKAKYNTASCVPFVCLPSTYISSFQPCYQINLSFTPYINTKTFNLCLRIWYENLLVHGQSLEQFTQDW